MHVYTVALPKGGSAKSTTAAELVAALARADHKVLAIDVDQQGNLTTRLGVTEDTEVEADTAEVLLGKASAADAAVASPAVSGAWVIAGTHALANLDTQPEIITSLRDYLPTIAGEWDAVVIDCPPAVGLLTLAALAAADTIIASVVCATEAYDQLDRLEGVIEQRIAPRMRPGQRVHWVVPARYDGRRLLDREVVEALEGRYPGHVTAPIREAVAVRDAFTAGLPVSVYDPRAKVTDDYAKALAPLIHTRDTTDMSDQPDSIVVSDQPDRTDES